MGSHFLLQGIYLDPGVEPRPPAFQADSLLSQSPGTPNFLWCVLVAQMSPTLTSIHALTRRTFVGKVMSLLFNMLSRLVVAFLPRNKHLLISWLQSPSAVILEPRKIKSDVQDLLFLSRESRHLGVAFQAPPWSQTSS